MNFAQLWRQLIMKHCILFAEMSILQTPQQRLHPHWKIVILQNPLALMISGFLLTPSEHNGYPNLQLQCLQHFVVFQVS